VAWAVFDRLAQLQPASDSEPVIWRFTPAAQAIFVDWLVPFEIELRSDAMHPAMVSHLAKYRKLIPALALVFALIDTPDSGNLIGEDELIRALAWGKYLRTHANRLYAAAVTPETTDAATLLSKIRGRQADRWRWRDPRQLHASTGCGERAGPAWARPRLCARLRICWPTTIGCGATWCTAATPSAGVDPATATPSTRRH
jgi:hypothetical protein